MSAIESIDPHAVKGEEGEQLWFLGSLATIRASSESTGGRVAVIEHVARGGTGSPPHVHTREDEWFYVIEGHMTFHAGEQTISAVAGTFVYLPIGVPHAFVVDGEHGARFLLVTQPAGFEGFVRELSVPATTPTVPPGDVGLPDAERMIEAAARYGMQILGPPPR